MFLMRLTSFCMLATIFNEMNALDIVDRDSWGAQPPKNITFINEIVPYVIIHHSYTPVACFTPLKCKAAMRSMQDFHQNVRGWLDIGYSFAIGGDENIYEGRGFNVVGAHAPRFNDKSIGICIIGDWQSLIPPPNMLRATQQLINHAIAKGYLSSNYTLLGHRQVRQTECPGESLYREIANWPHFGKQVPVFTNENENVL